MKKLVLSMLLLGSVGVQAEEVSCSDFGQLASSIMGSRQLGMPMSELMKEEKTEGDKLINKMVMEAYEKPRYSTDENRQRMKDDFRNTWELRCFKSRTQ